MFKVGMGSTPYVPDTLSPEGQEFLQHCLEHDPKLRWTASQLREHPFVKVGVERNVQNCQVQNFDVESSQYGHGSSL